MKRTVKYLIVAAGLTCMSMHSGCRTLSTTAGSPPSGPVKGMLYYLPIGKITIKGEFKSLPATDLPDGVGQSMQSKAAPAGSSPGASPNSGKPPDTEGPSSSENTISAGALVMNLTSEVEADEAAGEYYVTAHPNYFYEDETRVTVSSKQLLSTGNVTTEDKTVDIVGAVASIVSQSLKLSGRGGGGTAPKNPPPFYFSFHPTKYKEYKRVKDQLDERGITLTLYPEPTHDGKEVLVASREVKSLGDEGLIFRPAACYKIKITYMGTDERSGNSVTLINTTQQFILPDTSRLYEIQYPRMAFVKKVKEIGFTNGMLSDYHETVPSPILGFLGIPKAVLQAIVPIPGAAAGGGSGSAVGTSPPKS